MRNLPILLFLLLILLTAGCVTGPQETGVVSTRIPTARPTSAPALTTIQTPSDQDPIIGSWQNGMVFYANGTFGSDGFTSWRVNRDEKYSYFIITDQPSELDKARNITSTEWIYNPASDSIHKRGSLLSVYRKE